MAHFAKVVDALVTQVIVADQTFIDNMTDTEPGTWIQCSYNTRANVHLLGGTPFRANYPFIGDKWDPTNSIFHRPQPYASWTLNTTTGLWEPPIPMPNTTATNSDGSTISDWYEWDEDNQEWVKTTVTF